MEASWCMGSHSHHSKFIIQLLTFIEVDMKCIEK